MPKKQNNTNKERVSQDTKGQSKRDLDSKLKHVEKVSASEVTGNPVNSIQNHKGKVDMDTTRGSFTSETGDNKAKYNGSSEEAGKGANKGISGSALKASSDISERHRGSELKKKDQKKLSQRRDMGNTKCLDNNGRDTNTKVRVKKPSPYAREFDFTDCAYTPHTLSLLMALVALFLVVMRYYYYPHMSVVSSVKLGLLASAVSFITFGAMHLPDSLMVRPHPSVWRAVLAVALIYLALLSFLIFQDLDTVRAMLGYYDPSLLQPLPEVEYAKNCEIFSRESPFFVNTHVLDIFIFAHFFGYFSKTLILRDWRIATCVSIGFEVIEVCLQHLMLNMRECWWDHIVLDILLCNAGGTLLGVFALRFLQAKEYHWVELRYIQGYGNKLQRILGQLGPRSFIQFEWGVFHSPKRFLQILALICLVFVEELNCFTMKHILQIPHKHHLVILRLVMWGAVAVPTVREVYEYISNDSKTKRFGTTAWVGLLILFLETIWITKMAIEGNCFREPTPSYVLVSLMAALVLFILWFATYFGLISLKDRLQRRGVIYAFSNVLFYSCGACILGLFLMGLPDLQIGRAAFESFIAPYESTIMWWRT